MDKSLVTAKKIFLGSVFFIEKQCNQPAKIINKGNQTKEAETEQADFNILQKSHRKTVYRKFVKDKTPDVNRKHRFFSCHQKLHPFAKRDH